MCYMDSVGIRELRQNASVVIARVAETSRGIAITSRGRVVARLVPVTHVTPRTRDDLIAAGILRPGHGNPLEIAPVEAPPNSPSTDLLLAAERDSR
jgi:prevent-host-death family protein